jgi:hypothetical protein
MQGEQSAGWMDRSSVVQSRTSVPSERRARKAAQAHGSLGVLLRAQDYGQCGNASTKTRLTLSPRLWAIRNWFQARRPCGSVASHRDMQLKTHCVENIQNSCEVGLFWITCKCTMNARPRKPRFPRKVRNIVQMGGGGNGVTNFGDVRLLKRLIYAIGSGLPLVRLWACRGPDGFPRHVPSKQIGRHFCRPILQETM